MSLRRFMISSQTVCDGSASIDGDLYNHIVRVLRYNVGDKVQLVDENGCEYSGIIDHISKKKLSIVVLSSAVVSTHDSKAPRITICQALPKGDKIDLILQKGTELGACDFRLFGGRRSVAKVHDDNFHGKRERWNRITSEAARQCGRNDIPSVTWMSDATEAARDTNHELRLILWENERTCFLKTALSKSDKPATAIVAIGPEGGFTLEEVQIFSRSGFQPVSLGARILRTETAALAILAIMQYMWDEL